MQHSHKGTHSVNRVQVTHQSSNPNSWWRVGLFSHIAWNEVLKMPLTGRRFTPRLSVKSGKMKNINDRWTETDADTQRLEILQGWVQHWGSTVESQCAVAAAEVGHEGLAVNFIYEGQFQFYDQPRSDLTLLSHQLFSKGQVDNSSFSMTLTRFFISLILSSEYLTHHAHKTTSRYCDKATDHCVF